MRPQRNESNETKATVFSVVNRYHTIRLLRTTRLLRRNFTKMLQNTAGTPRFVILEHDWPSVHWDLMLEEQAALRTWRLAAPPDRPAKIDAEALPGHRLAYLDYEGPLSGDRGSVKRWDAGTYQPVEQTGGQIQVELAGVRVRGRVVLEAVTGMANRWTFHWVRDESAASS